MSTARVSGGKAAGGSRSSKGGKPARLDARAVEDILATAGSASDAVCVVTGPEEALRRLAVQRLLGQAAGGEITVVTVSAGDSGAATTIEHACEPTLFGGATWLLLSELELASDDVLEAAKRAMAAASADLRLIIAHNGAARGKGVVTAAQKAGARIIEVRPVAAAALGTVMTNHARRIGSTLTGDAAAAIIAALGADLTTALACVDQLACDTDDGTIDLDLVRRTLVAAGTDNQFEIADLVWNRRTSEALVAFRRLAERNGQASACVTVVAALSYSLRSLVRYVAERPGGSPWQVASALGVPTWKVDAIASQSKLWRPGQLAAAAVVLADADADAKGGLGDAGALDLEQKMFAVERLIGQLGRT